MEVVVDGDGEDSDTHEVANGISGLTITKYRTPEKKARISGTGEESGYSLTLAQDSPLLGGGIAGSPRSSYVPMPCSSPMNVPSGIILEGDPYPQHRMKEGPIGLAVVGCCTTQSPRSRFEETRRIPPPVSRTGSSSSHYRV
jgi:hypothetical protein